jgi:ESS family glutamate:Na+ symporter
MTVISVITLLVICAVSLFSYHTHYVFFKLIPFGLLAALGILLLDGSEALQVYEVTNGWRDLPGVMINVVFATLFLGKQLISPKVIWKFAGPQIVFGQTLAWGQYVLGIALTGLVLVPVYNMSPLAGALIEISFEGGHGTAAGLGSLFEELGFSEGADLALGLATVGIAVGLLSGIVMTGIFKARHAISAEDQGPTASTPLYSLFGAFIMQTHNRFFVRHKLAGTALQLMLVALAIALGYGLKTLLLSGENLARLLVNVPHIAQYVPVFPLAMIGGIILQATLKATGMSRIVSGETMEFIGAIALEVVIISAIATMSLVSIERNLEPFALLALVGTAWNLTAFLLLAPRFMSEHWFERGIGDYGQSMGMTATGLLLMRSADPANRSQAFERFGYKQLLFEPVVGGGLFTAASMILIANYGLGVIFMLTLALTLFWIFLGLVCFSSHRHHGDAGRGHQ